MTREEEVICDSARALYVLYDIEPHSRAEVSDQHVILEWDKRAKNKSIYCSLTFNGDKKVNYILRVRHGNKKQNQAACQDIANKSFDFNRNSERPLPDEIVRDLKKYFPKSARSSK